MIVVVVVMVTLTLMEGKSLIVSEEKRYRKRKSKTGKWSIVFVIGVILLLYVAFLLSLRVEQVQSVLR